jgi:hypothetical protein
MRLLHLLHIYTILFAAPVCYKRNFGVAISIYPQFIALFMDSTRIEESNFRKTLRRMENYDAR